MTNQTQAVIFLLDPNDTEQDSYISKQINDVAIQKQKSYLTHFCKRMGFSILKTIKISRDGKEFGRLAYSLRNKDQKIMFVAQDFKLLTRQPDVYMAFQNAFDRLLKEEKIDLISNHNELILEPKKSFIRDVKTFLEIVSLCENS